MMIIRIILALMVLVPALCPAGQSAKRCQQFTFFGTVEGKQAFHQTIGDNLVFSLEPSGAAGGGWTFEVGPPGDKSPLYVYYVTPPYRGRHPTYLDTSYGTPAQEAVMKGDKDFWFVLDRQGERKASDAVAQLIFSGASQSEEKSLEQLSAVHKGKGVFRILDSSFVPGIITTSETGIPAQYLRNGYPDRATLEKLYGKIKGLKFEVEMTIPTNFKLSPSLHVTSTTCPGSWLRQEFPYASMQMRK